MNYFLSPAQPRWFRWFASRTVRRAQDLRRQVRRLVNEQRDQLPPTAASAIEEADRALAGSIQSGQSAAAIEKGMKHLENAANERLLPYPHGAIRENIKEIQVAVTVIFAFTTFFLQLTKIPTNSMVPTLYGITAQDLRKRPDVEIPNRIARFLQYWTKGVSYYQVTAQSDGVLDQVESAKLVLPFVKKQRLRVGGIWYTVWLPPERLEDRVGLGQYFRAGDDVIKMRVVAGDHLLVDRLSYNFRRPRRGEIFVFKTKSISALPEGQLYIKRLVALSGERVRIGDDQHLVIDGTRLDASTPHFENVYTFAPEPKENHHFGHVNDTVARRFGRGGLAPQFRNENFEFEVGPRHYLAMGDNTLNSSDSRAWGQVPRENVIGKCWFVYWPFTDRFGWGVR